MLKLGLIFGWVSLIVGQLFLMLGTVIQLFQLLERSVKLPFHSSLSLCHLIFSYIDGFFVVVVQYLDISFGFQVVQCIVYRFDYMQSVSLTVISYLFRTHAPVSQSAIHSLNFWVFPPQNFISQFTIHRRSIPPFYSTFSTIQSVYYRPTLERAGQHRGLFQSCVQGKVQLAQR